MRPLLFMGLEGLPEVSSELSHSPQRRQGFKVSEFGSWILTEIQ
jgi:hypothetical protein